MKFQNCLLASDYDGTLYADDGKIQPDVLEAISYFQQNGGTFTVCTGRVAKGFHAYNPAYINAPVLVANGAAAFDYAKGKYVFYNGIGSEGVSAVRALMREFPELSIELYGTEEISAIHMSENTVRHFTAQDFSFLQVEDPQQVRLPWCKIMLDAGVDSQRVQDFLSKNIKDPIFLPTTGSFVEMLKRGVNKGTGLLRLADALKIPHNRVFAVGDGYNDVDMLKAAEIGFVPKNGSPEALAAAGQVVRSNNDGAVANVIEILDRVLKA